MVIDLPVTDRVSCTLIRIPFYPQLTAGDAEHGVQSIHDFFQASPPEDDAQPL
jgi:dTDP-4-amino-4,6-dideoxygalactose transaminase